MMDIYYEAIDENIRSLVYQLNRMPGIRTIGSCGGHETPNAMQSPIGEWFVSFKVVLKQRGTNSLAQIARVPQYTGSVVVDGKWESLVAVDVNSSGGYTWKSVWFSIYGRVVSGTHCDPNKVAEILASLQEGNT